MTTKNLLQHVLQGVEVLVDRGCFANGTPFKPSQSEALGSYHAFLKDPTRSDQNKALSFFDMATGLGKTALFAAILDESYKIAQQHNETFHAMIVVHSTEALEKTKFEDFKIYASDLFEKTGLYGGDFREDGKAITIITYESWLDLVEQGLIGSWNVDFIISDEGHRGLSTRRLKALEEQFPDTIKVGFSATTAFSPEKSLYQSHKNLVYSKPLIPGIQGGELAEYVRAQLYVFRVMPDDKLRESFSRNVTGISAQKKKLLQQTWRHNVLKICKYGIDHETGDFLSDNKMGIYTGSIRQANAMEQLLNDDEELRERMITQGCEQVAVAIHSKQTPSEQRKRIKELKSGKYGILVGDKKFMEGFDYPPLKTIIDTNHGSELYKEQINGRGSRKFWNEAKQRYEGLTVIDTITHWGSENPETNLQLEKEARAAAVTTIDLIKEPAVYSDGYKPDTMHGIDPKSPKERRGKGAIKQEKTARNPIKDIFGDDPNVKTYITFEQLQIAQNEHEAFREELETAFEEITMDMVDKAIEFYKNKHQDKNPTTRSGMIEDTGLAGRMLWSTMDIMLKKGYGGLREDPKWKEWHVNLEMEGIASSLHQRLRTLGYLKKNSPVETTMFSEVIDTINAYREVHDGQNPKVNSGAIEHGSLKGRCTWDALRVYLHRAQIGLSDDPEYQKWVEGLEANGHSPSLNELLITLGYEERPSTLSMEKIKQVVRTYDKNTPQKDNDDSGVDGLSFKILKDALKRGGHGLKSDPEWQSCAMKYGYDLSLDDLIEEFGYDEPEDHTETQNPTNVVPILDNAHSLLLLPDNIRMLQEWLDGLPRKHQRVVGLMLGIIVGHAGEITKTTDTINTARSAFKTLKAQNELLYEAFTTVTSSLLHKPEERTEFFGKMGLQIETPTATSEITNETKRNDNVQKIGRLPQNPKKSKSTEKEDALSDSFASRDPLSIYMGETGKVDLLTAEEEVALARRVQAGDIQAKKDFCEANTRLVITIARKYGYMNMVLPLADRIEEGNLGLIRAVEKFDPEKKNPENGQPFRFTTYATWWIRQSIERAYMNQCSAIRLPIHIRKELNTIHRAQREFRNKNHEEATPVQIAEILDMPYDTVQNLLDTERMVNATSLDAPMASDSDSLYIERVFNPASNNNPEFIVTEENAYTVLGKIIEELPAKQKEVIERRFGLNGYEPQTLEKVGLEMGFTREWTRQLQVQALKTLRNYAEITNFSLNSFIDDDDADIEMAPYSSRGADYHGF